MTLADSEIEYIEGILGRKMNELEEGMLDVMFSEHCSYKSSRPFLRAFPTEGENIILGPGDDAGLVSVTDKYAYWNRWNFKGYYFNGCNAYSTPRFT